MLVFAEGTGSPKTLFHDPSPPSKRVGDVSREAAGHVVPVTSNVREKGWGRGPEPSGRSAV